MKKIINHNLLIIFFLLVFTNSYAEKEPVLIKIGTVIPKGTCLSIGIEMVDELLAYKPMLKLLGREYKYKIYWGAIQGDEPQMIQKAKMGQLDVITITPIGMPNVNIELQPLMMPFLISNYGEFDYIIYKLRKYINQSYYKNGWIALNLATTEGEHYLFINGPYRTPEELRKNLIAGAYAGAADNAFYKPMGIPQTAVTVSDAFLMYKQGLLNGGILPSIMTVGMQLYVNQKYVIKTPIRFCPSAVGSPLKVWKAADWELKLLHILCQPFLYFGASVLHDIAGAFYESLLKVGIKEVELTPAELKAWKDIIIPYRKIYLGDDKQKNEIYDMIMKAKKEYANGNPIEKRIYENDPKRAKFAQRMRKVGKAIHAYQKNGSLKKLKSLERRNIIENWRIYGWVVAAEHYWKTGKPTRLKKWMKSFFIDEIVDELFSKHPDIVKKMLGSKESVNIILESFRKYLEFPRYKGYQAGGGFAVKK